MTTREFCEYCSKQPTNVDPEISISYFKTMQTTLDSPPLSICLWARRFAKEHETEMFAWDSIEDWIIFVTPTSDHVYVIGLVEGGETMTIVDRILPKNWKEAGMYKEIFDHFQKTQPLKVSDNHIMIMDHTVPNETYEITIRKFNKADAEVGADNADQSGTD